MHKFAETFSVLSLNLRFGLAEDGPNNWQFRKEVFPRLLGEYPADFLCLQEVNDFQTEFLNEILQGYKFIGRRDPSPSFWQNNIIFYRSDWQCLRVDHFYLSPTPTVPSRFRDSRWPRQCTMGIFEACGRRLICINTHFDFSEPVQNRSAELILRRLTGFPSGPAAILLGDFNATPECSCHRILTQGICAGEEGKLRFHNTFSQPYPGTHHGFTGKTDGDHIDWILYRGDIVPEDCRVIQNAFDGIYPSDHFPLFASFRWREIGGQRSEVRGQRSETRNQTPET